MCGWWIRELVDWSSGHLGKWEVPTSTYHVARLPGSPIANVDQLAPRRIDQPTPCVSAGNRNRLEGKSQWVVHARRTVARSGGTASRWPVGGMLLTYTGWERYEYLPASPCPGFAAGENTLWECPKPGRRQVLPAEADLRGQRNRRSPSSSTACARPCAPATTAPAPKQTYRHWVKRFIFFHHVRHPAEMAEPEINAFLTHLAVKEKVSASTQNQALSALLFLYRHVIGREVGDLGEVIRARKPTRLPVVMTREEVKAVLANLTGDKRLMASLMYGAGLRLMECLRLRVQDIDFSRHEILVRDGKGAKDRITMLPESLKIPLQEHLKKVKAIHEREVAEGWGRVQMPTALDRKYPERAEGLALAVGLSPGQPVDQSHDQGARPPSRGRIPGSESRPRRRYARQV